MKSSLGGEDLGEGGRQDKIKFGFRLRPSSIVHFPSAFLVLALVLPAHAAPAPGTFALYVSNYGNNTIQKYDAAGNATLFATNGVNGVLSGPTGLAMDQSGKLYVANAGVLSNPTNTVEVYDALGHGSPYAAPSGSQGPVGYNGMVFDSVGNLVIANDPGNRIIMVTNGTSKAVVKYDFNLSELYDPLGLAFDSAGNLYVANSGNNWIEKFAYPATNATQFIANFTGSVGLVFDSAGNLYASAGRDICKFNALGANKTLFASGLTNGMGAPHGMAFDGAGNLYAADYGSGKIFKFGPNGGIGTVFATSTNGLNQPAFIVIVDPQYDVGGTAYADSGDFTLDTTGVPQGVGGTAYGDSGDFTLDTTGTLPGIGGVTFADSLDFTLNTTGLSPPSYADSQVFTLDTRPAATTPFNLRNPLRLPSGAFQFSFTNTPGAGFSVFGVTNLTIPFSNWIFLGTVTDSPPGQFEFTDPQMTNYPQRFYRVRSP